MTAAAAFHAGIIPEVLSRVQLVAPVQIIFRTVLLVDGQLLTGGADIRACLVIAPAQFP